MTSVRDLVRFATPYDQCAYCKGRDPACRVCLGDGWLGKEASNTTPAALRATEKTADELGWWLNQDS